MSLSVDTRARRQTSTRVAAVQAIAIASVVAVALDTGVAAVAHAAGAPHGFRPLDFRSYAAVTVLGIIAGAVGWIAVATRADRPVRTLRRLVPLVAVSSLAPDVAVGASRALGDTTWGAVLALMVMHAIVIGVAVSAYAGRLPVSALRSARD